MDIAQTIDHTCLKATATEEDIKTLCEEAIKYNFKTVCIPPCYVPMATHLLQGTSIGITTVVGFPLGNQTPEVKAFETKDAVINGATDIDMVLNIGALKNQKEEYVKYDIESVVKAAKEIDKNTVVKVIIETCYLTSEEIKQATRLCIESGADFVKTSTGFGIDGAKLEHVQQMKKVAKEDIKIKAAGGIGDAQTAKMFLEAGADRLGTSRSISIVTNTKVATNDTY